MFNFNHGMNGIGLILAKLFMRGLGLIGEMFYHC
ncbi:Uncharacterised protein [Vibrio cholerae]|nr:Uncharacterised protein [Vibrio cholerae]